MGPAPSPAAALACNADVCGDSSPAYPEREPAGSACTPPSAPPPTLPLYSSNQYGSDPHAYYPYVGADDVAAAGDDAHGGPSAVDPGMLAAVARTGAGPPSFDYVPPPRPDGGAVPLFEDGGLTHMDEDVKRAMGMPLTASRLSSGERLAQGDSVARQQDKIIRAFHEEVQGDGREVVATMVRTAIVAPDVTASDGMTPLGTAARGGHLEMAKLLVSLGAEVDGVMSLEHRGPRLTRTPLLIAAEQGHLAMVKYLMALGADDAFIASDGQLALRLAADRGHRDVVAFLPARRGGAYVRWRTHHARMYNGIRQALSEMWWFSTGLLKLLLWHTPKLFVFDLPRGLLKALRAAAEGVGRGIASAYERRAAFPGWCRRQAAGAVNGARRAAAVVKRAVVAAPGRIQQAVVAAPRVAGAAAVELYNGVRMAAVAVATWLRDLGVGLGRAAAETVSSALSLAVTAALAVGAALARVRHVTPADVLAGARALGGALAGLPLALWRAACAFNGMLCSVLVGVFHGLGLVVFVVYWLLSVAVLFIPRRLLAVLVRLASSARAGVREVVVFFHPKW